MSTLAELNFRALLKLGDLPVDWISMIELYDALIQKLSVRVSLTRNASDTNRLLSTSAEFSAETEPVNITALIGNGTEAVVETRNGNGNFDPVRVVNIALLADYRNAGDMACAIYREESNNGTRAFIQFSVAPPDVCRIRFDRDEVTKNYKAVAALPDSICELVVLETAQSVIPRIKIRMTKNVSQSGYSPKDMENFRRAIDEVYKQNQMDITPLENLWRIWATRESGSSQNTGRRRTPSSRGLYG